MIIYFLNCGLNGQLDAISVLHASSQASYLSVCGRELAVHYRSGESPSSQEGVLQR